MKRLLYKELTLVLHPTTLLFLGLSILVLVPNYPYYVTFFYTCLGIFFLTLSGRENHDILYTMLLPVSKAGIVQARFLLAVAVELTQLLLAIPFAMIRNTLMPMANEAGMEANVAFFGLSLLMLGVFNYVFFTRHYRDTAKVGGPFAAGCIAFGVLMLLAETATFVLPFARDYLDTKDPQYLAYKLPVLGIGIVAYALLTGLAYRRSVRSFEVLDIA